jgi:arylsulfatase A-like enzyme
VCDVPVISNDFFPTILDMLGLPIPQEVNLDGVSIVPLLLGEDKLDRKAIFWHFPHYSNHGMQSPGGAIRCGDYKLLEYYENNTVQLFNLKTDIGEQHDLSGSEPEKVNELRSMLHKWREDVNAQMMPPNPEYLPVKQ